MTINPIASLESLLGLCLLAGLIYGPWQSYCTDSGRQSLFAQRDALFDLAAAGHVAFDDPAYRRLRRQIEALIRFAHYLTWPHALALGPWARRATSRHGAENILDLIESVPSELARREMKRIHNDSGALSLRVIIYKSPALLMASALAWAVLWFVLSVAPRSGKWRWRPQRAEAWAVRRTAPLIQAEAEALKV